MTLADSKTLRYQSTDSRCRPDFAHLIRSEASLPVKNSPRVALRFVHMGKVLGSRPRIEMGRVATLAAREIVRWVARVARVQYERLVGWWESVAADEGRLVRQVSLLKDSWRVSVARIMEAASPEPAVVWASDFNFAPVQSQSIEYATLRSIHTLNLSERVTRAGRGSFPRPVRFHFSTQGAFHAV